MKRKKWLAGIIGIAISASVIFAPVATVQAQKVREEVQQLGAAEMKLNEIYTTNVYEEGEDEYTFTPTTTAWYTFTLDGDVEFSTGLWVNGECIASDYEYGDMQIERLLQAGKTYTLKSYVYTDEEYSTYTICVKQSATSMEMTRDEADLQVGETINLTLTKKNVRNSITWKSSNGLVTVNKNGVVTAKKPGTAYITAKLVQDGKTYTSECRINVSKPYLSTSAISLYKGNSWQLYLYGIKNVGKQKVQWSTANKKIATVSKKGKVKAVKKGTTYIKCKVNNYAIKCKVVVSNPEFALKETTMTVGHKNSLYIYGGTGKNWKSSNKAVATVNKKGEIVPKKKGTTSISCKVNGCTLKCKVKVEKNCYDGFTKYTLDDISMYSYEFKPKKIYFDGKRLKVKMRLFNKTGHDLKKMKYMTIRIYAGGKEIVKKSFKNKKMACGAYSSKDIVLDFGNKNSLYKQVDLRNTYIRIEIEEKDPDFKWE